jgi:hypothetical protein
MIYSSSTSMTSEVEAPSASRRNVNALDAAIDSNTLRTFTRRTPQINLSRLHALFAGIYHSVLKPSSLSLVIIYILINKNINVRLCFASSHVSYSFVKRIFFTASQTIFFKYMKKNI